MRMLSKYKILAAVSAFFLMVNALPAMAGAYHLAWCRHADNPGANHFVAEISVLKIPHGCKTHESRKEDRHALDHSESGMHIAFTAQAAAFRELPSASMHLKELPSAQAHTVTDIALVWSATRLFSGRLTMAPPPPDTQIAALRTIVLRN